MIEEVINVKLTVLTPVHIGTGDEYLPTEYVIKGGYLHVLNKDNFMSYLIKSKQYDRFLALCSISAPSGIFQIRKFIFDHFQEDFSVYKVKVSRAVEENYRKNLTNYAQINDRVISQLAIEKLTRNTLNNEIYVPGSSLKGSLRTAILNYLIRDKQEQIKQCILKKKQQQKKIPDSLILEQCILQKRTAYDTSSDPFRAMKLSDLKLEKGKAFIEIARNIKSVKYQKGGRGIPVKLECIVPGSVFRGVMVINKTAFEEKYRQIAGIKVSLNKDIIIKACCYHYQNVWEEEKSKFGITPETTTNFNFWAPLVEKLSNSPNAFFIKLGKHSGGVAVTIKHFRKVDPSTTWMINQVPMGWCLVELQE
ncbi:MAG: type III-A CRISPR-associated RAMP protein Csm5 [Candidatus Desulfofervidaceae bacterium]|nr:type III-A CRISPR-associated RAMP protein Csm5 [Candidatus Desulfofervidaceae bacterium]